MSGVNWEESRALTGLKRDFLEALFDRHQEFFLTGGSALGVFYLEHRISYDLDFFALEEVNWHVLENSVIAISGEIGATYRALTTSPGFRRFELAREPDREILDFVIERTPQVDAEKNTFGNIRVDTLREITVNKICTLIGRCELKDIIDLYFLEKGGHTLEDHFQAAQTKEGGLDPAMISYLLAEMSPEEVPEYVLAPLELPELNRFIVDLRKRMAERSFPGEA